MLALTAQARNFYIPVAGAAPGANNTYFRTDVRIFNPSTTRDIDVTIHFLPPGQDNTNISGQVFHVPKRQMIVLNNVAGSLVGWHPPLLGALRLDSDTDADYNAIIDSRTYTEVPNDPSAGTYGQFIPALEVSSAIKKSVALHASASAASRTNVLMMNPQSVPATVTVSLVLPDGTLAAPSVTVTIPPMSMHLQLAPALFNTTRELPDAFVHFDSDQPIFSGISVIDNRTNDPFFVPGIEDRDEVLPLPGFESKP
jgi:hypothetical protein